MVQLSVGNEWVLPVATATDDVDGNISNLVTTNLNSINGFLVAENTYVFSSPGSYDISFYVSDLSGNSVSLSFTILVTEYEVIDFSLYDEYYISLETSSDIITDMAYLLRSTVNYISYGDARYVYTVYSNGNQVVMYDVPTSLSYGKVTAIGEAGWGDGGKITTDDFEISLNREHVWPCNNMWIMPNNSSRSLTTYVPFIVHSSTWDYRPTNTNKGHFSDLHNLWHSLASPNSTHSDRYYGEENGSSVDYYLENSIFYPGDEYVGDIARILLYMTLMYPHLTIVERDNPNAIVGSTYYGYLEDLLYWNEIDPVSDYEITRNENLYLIQGNRNPFIDYYDYGIVDIIFEDGDPNVLDVA